MLKRIEVAIFLLLSFEILKDPKYKRMHTVWTGLNEAFRTFFPGEDPVEWLNDFHRDNLIELYLCKGGAQFRPKINLLKTLSEDERAIATRHREYLEQFAKAWQLRLKAREKKAPPNFSIEERAEWLWNDGKSLEALKLLGYL